MTADNNVIQMPEPLETIGQRIDAAYVRTQRGQEEWIGGTLELAQALAEARARFQSNNDFGAWCGRNGHDRVNSDDRAALINMTENLPLAQIILEETERRSWQLIWRHEMKERFRSATKTESAAILKPESPPESTPAAKNDEPPAQKDDSESEHGKIAKGITQRSGFHNAPRAAEIAAMFQNGQSRATLARIWHERSGKQIWRLIVAALDAGLLAQTNRTVSEPTLSLLFPLAPIGYTRQFNLSNIHQRNRVRDSILPNMIACRDKLLADPERTREILAEHENTQRAKQREAAHNEKRAAAVKLLSPIEHELVMFGQTVWPRLDINQGEYTYDQVRAAIWTFRDYEAWNVMAKEDVESLAKRIRNSQRYLGEFVLRTGRDNPLARVYSLIQWFSRLMEKNPQGECKWPMYPHIEGQW